MSEVETPQDKCSFWRFNLDLISSRFAQTRVKRYHIFVIQNLNLTEQHPHAFHGLPTDSRQEIKCHFYFFLGSADAQSAL